MKTNQITIISIIAALLFALAGCDEPKGELELKEPWKPVSEMPGSMTWTINGPVDEAGNLTVLEEAE